MGFAGGDDDVVAEVEGEGEEGEIWGGLGVGVGVAGLTLGLGREDRGVEARSLSVVLVKTGVWWMKGFISSWAAITEARVRGGDELEVEVDVDGSAILGWKGGVYLLGYCF